MFFSETRCSLFSASVEISEQEWCEKILAFWWQHEQESSGCSRVCLSETGRLYMYYSELQ